MNPKEIGLDSPHFVSASAEVTRRIILGVEGLEKSGKSTFTMTAPDPIVVFNLDRGLEGIVQYALEQGKKVVVAGVDQGKGKMPAYYFTRPKRAGTTQQTFVQATADSARKVWNQFKEDYEMALESKARTLVVDTGSGAWELARFAAFGKLTQVLPIHYGPVKMEFQGLIQRGYDYDKNVLWISRLKPEWVDKVDSRGEKSSVKTGRFERAGYSDMGFEVQANVRVTREVDKKRKTRFTATVLDCRLNRGLDGEELEDEMCSFPYLAAMVFGGDVEDWE